MKTPEINLEELQKQKEDNFQDRMEFVKKYAEWIKKTKNPEWSGQQAEIINS
jgi:hypothetical protein